MPKQHLKKKDIQYWYFAPIRINFHYNADGEDSFIDTTVDIPMTAALTAELKETAQEGIPHMKWYLKKVSMQC